MAKFRTFPALGAFFASAALVAAGCGDSVPGNAVARVGDEPITRTTFNHWLRIAAIEAQGPPQQQGRAPTVNVPQPPDFAACIADKRAKAPKPARGQKAPSSAEFRRQCRLEYESLRERVLQFLIGAEWVFGEAAEQDVSVSDRQLRTRFETLKKQSFRREKDFQNFLVSSGLSRNDLLFRLRYNLLTEELREKVTKGKDKVTDAEIRAYYEKNKQRFAQPERRDLRLILTKTKARADQAKAAVESGQSFTRVARRFSIDQTTKSQGGALLGYARGQYDRALDTAVFKARRGQLVGPVKTKFGYYVFKVQKVTPATQQTLLQTRDTIRQILATQNQQKALDTFVKSFRDKWKSRTNCRDGFVTQDMCKNSPTPKTQPSAPPGAVPQPQPQQPQPAQPAPR